MMTFEQAKKELAGICADESVRAIALLEELKRDALFDAAKLKLCGEFNARLERDEKKRADLVAKIKAAHLANQAGKDA